MTEMNLNNEDLKDEHKVIKSNFQNFLKKHLQREEKEFLENDTTTVERKNFEIDILDRKETEK